MNKFWKNPVLIDPVVAVVLVHVVLTPMAWYIQGNDTLESASFMENAMRPLFLYMSFVGLVTGLVGGYFRRKDQQSRQSLSELLQERESLLRVLAHDLTNSVGSSRTLVSLINEDGRAVTTQDDRESLQSVESSLGNAMDLIGLARELLALESGKTELAARPTALDGLIQDCVRLNQGLFQAKGVALKLHVEPGCREAMVEPVSLLNCVLGNLVSNAVKFSLPGSMVELGLRQSGNCLRLDVVNTGSPVPAAKVSELFNFTGRTSTPGTAGERGTGFGLPLARRFARLMGGDVRFSQEPVRDGSAAEGRAKICFSVIVPAAAANKLCRHRPIRLRKAPALAHAA